MCWTEMRDNARALLIAAGGGFGDTFLASMCASALRSKYAAVDAVVLPGHIDALLHGADVDEIYSAMQPAGELAAELRGRRYAAAVVTWATPATALLAVRSGAPLRVGQARRLYSFLFNRRVVVRSELGDEKTHWSEILLDYPRALGCETALPWPRFEIRTEEEAEADELLRALAVKGEFIALHPVSAIAPRRPYWPVDGWRRVVERIGERYALPVVILGSAADAKIADRIAAGTGAISAVGRTTYGGLAAVDRGQTAVRRSSDRRYRAGPGGYPVGDLRIGRTPEDDHRERVALPDPLDDAPPTVDRPVRPARGDRRNRVERDELALHGEGAQEFVGLRLLLGPDLETRPREGRLATERSRIIEQDLAPMRLFVTELAAHDDPSVEEKRIEPPGLTDPQRRTAAYGKEGGRRSRPGDDGGGVATPPQLGGEFPRGLHRRIDLVDVGAVQQRVDVSRQDDGVDGRILRA